MIRPRFALLALGALVACSGTETDNPVVSNGGDDGGGDFVSPDRFRPPPPQAPPCSDADEDELGPPQGSRGLLFQTADRRSFLAQGDYVGLELWDVSDPAQPALVSREAVRGTIHQLLPAAPARLWVAATEPPALDQSEFPAPEELDPALHVVELDVSDPAAPVRRAGATLANSFWDMRRRAEDLWVLSGRLVPAQRGCGAPGPYFICRYNYEAVELQGLHPTGDGFEPIARAELPLGRRVWWGTDGLATLSADGKLHVLRWDASGALQGPLEIAVPVSPPEPDSDPIDNGPVEIVGDQLLWVGYANQRATLYRFDLDSGAAQPSSSFDLGPRPGPPGAFSLFASEKLWLNPANLGQPAQLWDLGGTDPVAVALPDTFNRLQPLPGAVLDSHPGALVALGLQQHQPVGTRSLELLALDAQTWHVASELDSGPYSPGPFPAPPELHGDGTAPTWNIVLRGAGLPLGVDPAVPRDDAQPWMHGFVGISDEAGALRAEAVLYETPSAKPQLEIHFDGGTKSFTVPQSSDRLIPVPNGLLVLGGEQSSPCLESDGCQQSVTIFDVSSAPRLVRSLPLPTPDVGVPLDPSRGMYVNWTLFDPLGQGDGGPQPLDSQHVAFVADVLLSCDRKADCDKLGIIPVAIEQAGVNIHAPACPLGNPTCMQAVPPTPTEHGWGERQYAYSLQIAGAGAPRWQLLGVSGLRYVTGNSTQSSAFAAARALNGTVAVTRLERVSPSGELLPERQRRFVLDRYRLSPSGKPEALPSANVPGFPAAYIGTDGLAEYWLSAEPLPGDVGTARLHRLQIGAEGAESQQQVEIEGTFAGFWPLQVSSELRGVVLSNPANGCGVTHLSAVALGTPSSDSPLEITSQLDLPSDRWRVVGNDGVRLVLQRNNSYALIELDESGTLRLAILKSSAQQLDGAQQLLGTTLRGTTGSETATLDF